MDEICADVMAGTEQLPKVISKAVGQTCRFAATPGRASPTFSRIAVAGAMNRMFGRATPLAGALLLVLSGVAVDAQNTAPPTFEAAGIPEAVHAGAQVIFAATALDDETPVTYELLSAPEDVLSFPGLDRGWPVLAILWNPDVSTEGTTNVFVVRATDEGEPPLSATNIMSIRVMSSPPISSVSLSNGIPVLTSTGLIPERLYELQFTTSLPSTNWMTLTEFRPAASEWTIPDTLGTSAESRFYRLRPSAIDCYNGAICP